MQTPPHRIQFLDGLRGLAAIGVVFFHYFCRWPNKEGTVSYPNTLATFPLFELGHFGVQLFFMISGYVIFMTLQKSPNFWDFIKKRWIRLFPAMAISTIIIFTLSRALPSYHENRSALDTLPGLLFIDPVFLKLITGQKFASLDGVFWTLYIEAQFYLIVASLFFIFRHRTLPAFIIFTALCKTWSVINPNIVGYFYYNVIEKLLIFSNLPWFAVGMALYAFERREKLALFYVICALALVMLQGGMLRWAAPRLILLIIFTAPFFILAARNILTSKPLLFLGYISYPLYLTHQNIGVGILYNFRDIPFDNLSGYIQPLLMIPLMIGLAYLITHHLETPIQGWLKKKLIPSQAIH